TIAAAPRPPRRCPGPVQLAARVPSAAAEPPAVDRPHLCATAEASAGSSPAPAPVLPPTVPSHLPGHRAPGAESVPIVRSGGHSSAHVQLKLVPHNLYRA